MINIIITIEPTVACKLSISLLTVGQIIYHAMHIQRYLEMYIYLIQLSGPILLLT